MNTNSHSVIARLRDIGSAPHDGVARLDMPAADGKRLALEIHMHAGSSGVSVRSDHAREIAHDYPWALSETTDR